MKEKVDSDFSPCPIILELRHQMKLIGNRFRIGKIIYCFIQQIIKLWNLVVVEVVMAMNVDDFERGLDGFT